MDATMISVPEIKERSILALTAAFFLVLMVVPVLTVHDGFWIH